MKILVTGGAGFIGSHIVDALVLEGHDVHIIDSMYTGRYQNINEKAAFYEVDIRDGIVLDIFQANRFDAVIHQAAQVSVSRSLEDADADAGINILGSINILECCRKTGVSRIIYAASAAMYGDPKYLPVDENHPLKPISPYGISKHTVHHYLEFYREIYGLDFMELVYANVYGPRQDAKGEGGVVAVFSRALLSGETPLIYGDGEQTRDFIYVGDVAAANVAALSLGSGQVCNISCAKETSINTLLSVMKAVAQVEVTPCYLPSRSGDIRRSCLSNTRGKEVLKWKPVTDLESGIEKTIEAMRCV